MSVQFINKVAPGSAEPVHGHSHDGNADHSHDHGVNEHGHTHEHLDDAGE